MESLANEQDSSSSSTPKSTTTSSIVDLYATSGTGSQQSVGYLYPNCHQIDNIQCTRITSHCDGGHDALMGSQAHVSGQEWPTGQTQPDPSAHPGREHCERMDTSMQEQEQHRQSSAGLEDERLAPPPQWPLHNNHDSFLAGSPVPSVSTDYLTPHTPSACTLDFSTVAQVHHGDNHDCWQLHQQRQPSRTSLNVQSVTPPIADGAASHAPPRASASTMGTLTLLGDGGNNICLPIVTQYREPAPAAGSVRISSGGIGGDTSVVTAETTINASPAAGVYSEMVISTAEPSSRHAAAAAAAAAATIRQLSNAHHRPHSQVSSSRWEHIRHLQAVIRPAPSLPEIPRGTLAASHRHYYQNPPYHQPLPSSIAPTVLLSPVLRATYERILHTLATPPPLSTHLWSVSPATADNAGSCSNRINNCRNEASPGSSSQPLDSPTHPDHPGHLAAASSEPSSRRSHPHHQRRPRTQRDHWRLICENANVLVDMPDPPPWEPSPSWWGHCFLVFFGCCLPCCLSEYSNSDDDDESDDDESNPYNSYHYYPFIHLLLHGWHLRLRQYLGFNSRRDIQRRMRYNILTGWITNDEMSSDSRLRAWIEAPTASFNPRPEHHDMFPQFYFTDSTGHSQAVTTADSGTVGDINGEHPIERDQQHQQQQQQHGYQIKPPGGALEMRELEQHPSAVEGDNGSASTTVNPTS